ncbi:MAG: FAD-binding protein [Halieaceae bacterium]|jgi:3-oxosteroid 1-dehydrogenase|nr:FAD-binding protein [Halieaceae bacterium]
MTSNAIEWDHSYDFVIVGTGVAAMVAAITAHDLGASTLLIEKSPQYGGSSAMSGGGLWVPNNHKMEAEGFEDSYEEALTYMKGTVGEEVSELRMRSYLTNAPKIVQYLCQQVGIGLNLVPDYADYYQDIPGSKEGGRTLEAAPFDARQLDEEEFLQMRQTAPQELILNRISMNIPEAQSALTHSPGWIQKMAGRMFEYLSDIPWRFKSKRDRRCAMGNALIGSLRLALKRRDIPLWLNTQAKQLIMENGHVLGLTAVQGGKGIQIKGIKGVLFAAGGFDNSGAMRDKYLPKPTLPEWSCGNPFSTGDAITMGLEAGAALEMMDEAWWGPTVVVPGEERARMLVIEKSLPGGVMVNKQGQRFVKETAAYNDIVKAMYASHSEASPCVPAYLIFDANFRKKYPVGPLLPGAQQPDWAVSAKIKELFIKRADSLDELAELLGIDAAGLTHTVKQMNDYARSGVDPVFNRGENAFDQFYGDKSVTPNPCLGPIVQSPFYGFEVYPGELGTKGGLKVDEYARVLTESGECIPGLYAAGNCSAPVMGRSYPGAGSTLGPAATFGFVAANNAIEGELF